MVDPRQTLNLKRDQLTLIANGDQQVIKALETVFQSVGVDTPDEIAVINGRLDAVEGDISVLHGVNGAANVGALPGGNLGPGSVQDQLYELDNEKASKVDVQHGVFSTSLAGGTSDAITASFTPNVLTLTAGLPLEVRASTANLTVTPTFSPDGLTAKIIVKGNGLPLAVGDIAGAGHWLQLTYDLLLDRWVLLNPAKPVSKDLFLTSVNGGQLSGMRNRVMNGSFNVNERAVAGAVVLGAGAYGHDRWKAGAGGCSYTFAASGVDTIITISAGSLMQIIDANDVEGGIYVLSQAGTAQARTAVNGAATAGAYAATPLQTSSATGGQAITIEFTTGTVSKVQLEAGVTVSTFERRPYSYELDVCQYYYWRGIFSLSLNASSYAAAVLVSWPVKFSRKMRIIPTLNKNTAGAVYTNLTTETFGNATRDGAKLSYVTNAITTNANVAFGANDYFEATADL